MDKLPAHKVAGVVQAIEAVGASVLYLPSYSPDLNPIELFFSKLKALLRKAAERYRTSGAEFVCSFVQFAQKNALISSATQVMHQHEREML